MGIEVLLADDHAIVRDGLRMILEAQEDLTVVGDAIDGRDAVSKARELSPDIVIMDISMPELNGIEAAAQFRRHCPKTKIIILSMHSTSEYVYRALQAGALGYLVKESAGKEVVDAIRTVYAGHRYLSAKIADNIVDDYVRTRAALPADSPIARLSDREREVLQLVVEGNSSAEIAERINLSAKTVETYRSRLMKKLNIHDLPALVKFAIEHGLTPSE